LVNNTTGYLLPCPFFKKLKLDLELLPVVLIGATICVN